MYLRTLESHCKEIRTIAEARRPEAGVATLEMLFIGDLEKDPVTG